IPGLVEIHTDNLERHMMPRPKVYWAETPALLAHDAEIAAAGITTVFDALGVGDADHEADSLRGNTWDPMVQALDHCSGQNMLRADHFIHVRCELPAANTRELFTPFEGHRQVKLLSLMDHTPGQRQWENLEHARIYYIGKKGWSEDKFERQVRHAERLQAEYVVPNRAHFVQYCRDQDIAMASHDDTTVEHVEQAHAEGIRVSEFPTTEAAARAAHAHGMLTVMGGPNVVRGGSHSGNVGAAQLASKGLLDILSSDYIPSSLLSAVVRLEDDGIMDLPAAVQLVTRKPAQATQLHDRGEIAQGLRADLVQMRLLPQPDGRRQAVVRAVWREGQRVL
ncbi:MAG: alpha-D-ribose 1-methylphosphonate 5-triphosphate diphosphatase, partial [Brachymonas sp.]|nr:alpha-D-ribose 1-methylphosphonate 5-triphosphate diphosphatase [Brachymonas sp.]